MVGMQLEVDGSHNGSKACTSKKASHHLRPLGQQEPHGISGHHPNLVEQSRELIHLSIQLSPSQRAFHRQQRRCLRILSGLVPKHLPQTELGQLHHAENQSTGVRYLPVVSTV